MYIHDNTLHHIQQYPPFCSVPDLRQDGHTNTTTFLTRKRKRTEDDEHPDFKKIISRQDHQLDFLNSPYQYSESHPQSVTLLQSQETTQPITLHTSIHAPTATSAKRRKQPPKTPLSPRAASGSNSPHAHAVASGTHRCSTAPPQLQTDIPAPLVDHRVSSPAISPKTVPISMLMLRACHICHRKPHTRIHLENYFNCDMCVQRTCFICIRECGSPLCGGRRDDNVTEGVRPLRMCSQCSVECGDVVRCRDCFEEDRIVIEEPEKTRLVQQQQQPQWLPHMLN